MILVNPLENVPFWRHVAILLVIQFIQLNCVHLLTIRNAFLRLSLRLRNFFNWWKNSLLSALSEVPCQVTDPFTHKIIWLSIHHFFQNSLAFLMVLALELVACQFIIKPLLFGWIKVLKIFLPENQFLLALNRLFNLVSMIAIDCLCTEKITIELIFCGIVKEKWGWGRCFGFLELFFTQG